MDRNGEGSEARTSFILKGISMSWTLQEVQAEIYSILLSYLTCENQSTKSGVRKGLMLLTM